MAKHERVGSSTAERTINCPGWLQLAETMPPAPTSTYAEEGTMLHTAMEMILNGDVNHSEKVIGLQHAGLTLTRELFDECIAPAVRLFDDNFGDAKYVLEQKVMLTEGVGGTADVFYRQGATFGVIDFKFGAGVHVSVENNAQGLLLLNGAYTRQVKTLRKLLDGAEEAEVCIIAPRQNPSFARWRPLHEDVEAFRRKLLFAVRLAEGENPPFTAGRWCKFCPGKAACPLMREDAMVALGSSVLTAEAVPELLDVADRLEGWIDAVRSYAHQQLEAGTELAGWKLVQKRASRRWLEGADVYGAMRRFGLTEGDVYNKELLSPAQMEKVLKARRLEPTLIEPLVEKCSSGTTIARDSDKRPAVTVNKQRLELLRNRLR